MALPAARAAQDVFEIHPTDQRRESAAVTCVFRLL
jgi:hypothetical protein